MDGVRPWQIVVLVLALLSVCGSVFYTCSTSDKVKQADSVIMVDIATGELFEAPRPGNHAVMFPGKNPTTGKATLYPAHASEGKWRIDVRFLPEIRKSADLKKELTVDWKTGEVQTTSSKPTRADIFAKK